MPWSVVPLLFQKQFRTEAYRSILWLVNDDNISKGNRSPPYKFVYMEVEKCEGHFGNHIENS